MTTIDSATAAAVDSMTPEELLAGLEGLAPPEEHEIHTKMFPWGPSLGKPSSATAPPEEHSDEHWYPRDLLKRADHEWPPVPTAESLSFFFADAVRTGEKYISRERYRRLIDTAAYCLDQVPADIAENVLYHMPVSSGRNVDPEKWAGTFNKLASVLWRPPVGEHEVRMALLGMMKEAA